MTPKQRLSTILVVIASGLISRIYPFTSELLNKYLGDALYAILIYLLLGHWLGPGKIWQNCIQALLVVSLIECFQLSGIPLRLYTSRFVIFHLMGLALGTHFSWWDMLAYLVGLAFSATIEGVYQKQKALL